MEYQISTFAQEQIDKYLARVAELNGVDVGKLHKTFSVKPNPQQSLEEQIRESIEILKLIKNVAVINKTGQKLGLGVSVTAGRTDISKNRRNPSSPIDFDQEDYECVFTELDSELQYEQADAWAHDPRFRVLVALSIAAAQAEQIIMVGFNGTRVAKETDATANPLGEDVNIGWLEKIRKNAPQNYLKDVVLGGPDYKTLDGLVLDMRQSLIHPRFKNDPKLVAIVGRGLMSAELLKLVDNQSAATEKLAADVIVKNARVGGLPVYDAPFFPEKAVLVTRLDNLARYYQKDGRRRRIVDEPEYNRVANYESSNDAYVVETYKCAALADGITFASAGTGG